MRSVDIANTFLLRHGDRMPLTNLKLNKLVYYAQVESVRTSGRALFDDEIEAWRYGPVARAVYDEFKRYGRSPIPSASGPCTMNPYAVRIVDDVAESYGQMSAFDLVELTHREGGAWRKVFSPDADEIITVADIAASRDMEGFPGLAGTAVEAIAKVTSSIPNALNLLKNS